MNRLQQIEQRMAEIRTQLAGNGQVDLDTLHREIEDLNAEKNLIEKRNALMNGLPAGSGSRNFQNPEHQPVGQSVIVNNEKRGASLKKRDSVEFGINEMTEFRAVTIGGGNLVVPTHTSDSLNPAFNEVSSVIDVVTAVPLPGGESYKKGFVVGYGEGDYTGETADYTDADPVTDYVTIGKAKITAYSEISDEAAKLPDAMYQEMVRSSMVIALRKKVAKQIINGIGGSNTITGIFNAPTNVIPTASDMAISSIDESTLDNIVFGYGGNEDIEGGTYLFLNKKDLAAFAAMRDANGNKIYKITIDQNGNGGTITSNDSYSVRYIINSACPALSDEGTEADTYCMAYGKPRSYEMPLFSPMVVEESRDFKFKSGQICYRGSVWVGGNVASYKGFMRIKKDVPEV